MTDQKDICPDVFGDDAPKTPPEKTKGDSQAPPPTCRQRVFVSFDVSLLGHWAHEFSVVV